MRQAQIHSKLHGLTHNVRLGHLNERRVNLEPGRPSTPALVARFAICSKACNELGPAIRIAGIIDGVDAEENVRRARDLRIGQRE